tara:strand:- start:178 stop:351 length:174 start_codon:yes stop_codon:yes gene_type:complete
MPRLVKYGMIFSNANAYTPSQNYFPGSGVGARTKSVRRRLMAKATDKTKPCSIKCDK